MFTLLPLTEIDAVLAQHAQNPEARLAQRLLAGEVTELIHGGAQFMSVRRGISHVLTPIGTQKTRCTRRGS